MEYLKNRNVITRIISNYLRDIDNISFLFKYDNNLYHIYAKNILENECFKKHPEDIKSITMHDIKFAIDHEEKSLYGLFKYRKKVYTIILIIKKIGKNIEYFVTL